MAMLEVPADTGAPDDTGIPDDTGGSGARLTVEPAGPRTGVRLAGVRVTDLTDPEIEAIRHLIGEHGVGVFPAQHLTPEEHVAFMARFAPITFTPGVDPLPGHPQVHVVADNGGTADRGVRLHTDTCFVARPPAYTSLSAVEIPAQGGDTIFVNQYDAYESLSPVMQGWLRGLRFKHVVSGTARPEAVPDPVWHPAVRTHPVTGRQALYVTLPERCVEAEGMTPAESEALIGFLYAHSESLLGMYRHRWSVGDLVMWDNRCTLHSAVPDHGPEPRVLYRVMCEGEAPYE